jgi:SRSO17 transposase
MTARRECPPAAAPLEGYAAQFDPLFRSLAQRRSFREYLTGLLLPRDRSKTLTALAGAEPVVQAQAAAVQRLQFFLSESTWDVEVVNERRLALLRESAVTAPHSHGVLVLDDTGDRKDGTATAHVARQYLGSVGKIDQGIVAVTTRWADDRGDWPVHVAPYTPAAYLPEGKRNPTFRTKPQIALTLIERAQALGLPFRAVVADCFYGDHDGLGGRSSSVAFPMSWPAAAGSDWDGLPPKKLIPLKMRPRTFRTPLGRQSPAALRTATRKPGGRPN